MIQIDPATEQGFFLEMNMNTEARRLAYPLTEVREQLGGISELELTSLIKANRLITFAIGRKRLMPHSELERAITELSRADFARQVRGGSIGE